jgi:hypothetical protein
VPLTFETSRVQLTLAPCIGSHVRAMDVGDRP